MNAFINYEKLYKMNKQYHLKGLLPLIVISILLVGMFLTFLSNFDKRNESVIKDIQDGNAVVLSPDCNEKTLSNIIFNDGYAETKEDADFIASVLIQRQNELGRLPSLYTLQKRAFGQVPADTAAIKKRLLSKLDKSYPILGQNDTVFSFSKDSIRSGGKAKMTVVVYKKVESDKWWKKLLKMEDTIHCKDVPVRLCAHFRDSLNKPCKPAPIGFDSTDYHGEAIFEGLDTTISYSVLPIQKGFEYGTSKGTVGGKWKLEKSGTMSFSFEQKEHRIPLFSNATLRQIKSDRTIMVRSPQEYKAIFVRWFVYVMLAWWVLCLYMIIRKKKFNGALVAACMFLTGLCVLMMFSMQDPLNDELHGVGMGKGVVYGLIVCLLLQGVDFVKFYQNKSKIGFDIPTNVFRWFFKPYRQKVAGLASTLKSDKGILKKMLAMILVLLSLPFLLLDLLQITRLSKAIDKLCDKLPKGIGWLVVALLLTALLWSPFGQSIGGMKVNLNLFGLVFQPSEIAKYLILLFMAAFFTQQADTIIAYSQPNRIKMIGSKVKTLLWIIIGLAVLMAMYLALGDMGPGLVIGITFILLYSLIKSKVNLEHLDEEGRWKRIFSCDFAMLIYGVLSFVGFLLIGYRLGGKESALLFGSLWFVFWIALGYLGFKKQLFESALLFNAIVFLFIFGGQILSYFPSLKDSSTVERFEARTRMCVNTWGDLDIEHLGKDAKPVSNTQVANGLWALATGGIRGQGWGGGKPSLVPAFHTDMILSSIGEQMGWMGLLMVVIALAVLLRKMAVIGYRVGHPFAFYLCLGFAIVIGVQFFIIALGSSGMIPLTGVTVPFLSFGRVSMILNLAAFGIVLSLCNNIREDETAVSANVRQKSVEQYSYPIAMVTMVFLFFAVSTLLVWQYYQLWKRDNTLIHPVYVHNTEGKPDVQYNPRINLLVRNMYAGRIYDRNGILLATSDKSEITPKTYTGLGIEQKKLDNMLKRNQKRYYPMGEHLFFMVGDQNEGVLFSYNEKHPVGYMAEAQHLSYLRGFDNVLYNKNGKPIKVKLKTDKWKEDTYLAPIETMSDSILLRDYSELLKYLKDGIDGKKVAQHNKQVKEEKYDLHLTIDAALQADLQNSIAEYVNNNNLLKGFNFMRISAVVLDAKNGDLLASANYPLPNYDRLRAESEANTKYYSDNEKEYNWPVYTDRDLGTTYQTAPGSTAKVMSAIAGFMKMGTVASTVSYPITNANAIEKDANGYAIEPTIDNYNPRHRHNPVTMKDAIVESSNCYFVSLVNDKDIYGELKTVYDSIGINIGGITPYYFSLKKDAEREQKYYGKIDKNKQMALRKYELFKQGKLEDPKDKKIKPMNQTNMSVPEWKWAWGQNSNVGLEISASPLNMARVAATVVNGGSMPVTQYLLSKNKFEEQHRNEGSIRLMSPDEAIILKEYMLAEAANQYSRQKQKVSLPSNVGGKTGTPERSRVLRSWQVFSRKENKYITKTVLENKGITNDGWYMFFVDGDSSHHPIAVAVRMERLRNVRTEAHAGSGAAVLLVGNKLLDCLDRHKDSWKK